LNVTWEEYNDMAKVDSLIILWDKATWKKWLVIYEDVINKYIDYINEVGLGITVSTHVVIWRTEYDTELFSLT